MKKILGFLLVIILLFVGFIATRPGTFHIERSTTIAAPAETVYAQVADFHAWGPWSPWEGLDPSMQKTIEGAGVGSTYQWTGNDKVGEGRMTITEAQPSQKIGIKLEFIKPWTSTCTAAFAFAPEGANTRVTWSMDGKNDFMAKAMGVFMNMDKMVGGDFDKGLAQMKTVSEAAAAAAASPADTTTAAAE